MNPSIQIKLPQTWKSGRLWSCAFLFALMLLSPSQKLCADPSVHPCTPPPDGLVSWWGGDNDSGDLQGDNNGILENGTSYAPGFVSRRGFSFHGVDQYVQVGDTPTLKMSTAMTLEGWIYPTAFVPGASIIANREGEYELILALLMERLRGLSQTPTPVGQRLRPALSRL